MVRISRPSASFSTWLDERVDAGAGFGELARGHPATPGQLSTAVRELVEIGFERALEDVAALGELFDLAGDKSVDAAAALGELVEVVLQRLGQAARPTANFSTWLVEEAVDAGDVGLKRLDSVSRPWSSLCICSATMPLDICRLSFSFSTSVSSTCEIELRPSANFWIWLSTRLSIADKIGLEGARKDVAAFGELFDLCRDDAVDVGARLGRACRDPLPARATGCCGLRPACRHGRRPFRQCSDGLAPVSASLR